MLISFSCSNFRSIKEEQTLSFVASKRQQQHSEHLREVGEGYNVSVLPCLVVYGPNGAGKSALFKALQFMSAAVLSQSGDRDLERDPFRFDAKTLEEPTVLDVRFEHRGRIFEYGFALSDRGIEEEWLVEILPDESEHALFSRSLKGLEHQLKPLAGSPLQAALTIGAKPERLFLNSALDLLDEKDLPLEFLGTAALFRRLEFIYPGARYHGLLDRVREDRKFSILASNLLRGMGTGVSKLEVRDSRHSGDEFGSPPEFEFSAGEGHVFRKSGDDYILSTLFSGHVCADGEIRGLPFREESDGTRRLAHLAPALEAAANRSDKIFIIDELDSSLHPTLAKKFVEMFLSASATSRAQLLVTTHETYILDQKLLRRDEIWFCEKSRRTQATSVYSLSDFVVRADVRLGKGYLQGRFGAIPTTDGSLEWLTEEHATP